MERLGESGRSDAGLRMKDQPKGDWRAEARKLVFECDEFVLKIIREENSEMNFCSDLGGDGEATGEVELPVGFAEAEIDAKVGKL